MAISADPNYVTIASRVAQLQQGLSGHLPDDVRDAFGAEQDGLDANGTPAGVAVPGDRMPDAQLLDVIGAPITFSEAVDGSGAVVVLYRGAWCPYCNLTLRAYQEDLVPYLAERDIPLVAISPQKPDGSLSAQEKNELTFTVLSDPGNQVAAALGVLTAPTEDARAAQRTVGDRRRCRQRRDHPLDRCTSELHHSYRSRRHHRCAQRSWLTVRSAQRKDSVR
jgi:peroxiredoxin